MMIVSSSPSPPLTMVAAASSVTAAASRIKRVVSCFLVTQGPVVPSSATSSSSARTTTTPGRRTGTTTTTTTTQQQSAAAAAPSQLSPTYLPTEQLRSFSSTMDADESEKGSCGTSSGREELRVAVFHRQLSMPTFPGHWAACSGSIEEGESPAQAALREIQEETTAFLDGGISDGTCWASTPSVSSYGLFVDVPFPSQQQRNRTSIQSDGDGDGDGDGSARPSNGIIRVYPFLVTIPSEAAARLQLRGTEHDTFQWVSVSELETLEPSVPGLARAFHHASLGAHLPHDKDNSRDSPVRVAREWASDRDSGANAMATSALHILSRIDYPRQRSDMVYLADCMLMMRPSMVAITNALMRFKKVAVTPGTTTDPVVHPAIQVRNELEDEVGQAVQRALDALRRTIQVGRRGRDPSTTQRGTSNPAHLVIFSRSSTLVSILRQLGAERDVVVTCSRSSPGDEGVIMARDLSDRSTIRTHVVDDSTLLDPSWWHDHPADAVLVGSDCVLAQTVYNKVGTKALAEVAHRSGVPVLCCGDRFKAWDDCFPPPVEDIFEAVPRGLLHQVIQ